MKIKSLVTSVTLSLLALSSLSLNAYADNSLQSTANLPFSSLAGGSQSDWQVSLGAGGSYAPDFVGSNDYTFNLIPAVMISWKNLLFLSSPEGLGIHFFQQKNYSASFAINYSQGRKVSENRDKLSGLGDINPYATANLFGKYKSHSFFVYGKLTQALQSSRGTLINLSTGYNRIFQRGRGQITAGPEVQWASSNYMGSYFTVDNSQSINSGLTRYHANAGLLDIGLGFNAYYLLTKHWFINGFVKTKFLDKQAGDSPIVQKRMQHIFGLTTGYTL